MSSFNPTHQLMGPAGEEIPVMLVNCSKSANYLVITEVEYEDGYEEEMDILYQWHPYGGVTYDGFKLDGLEILPLTGYDPVYEYVAN